MNRGEAKSIVENQMNKTYELELVMVRQGSTVFVIQGEPGAYRVYATVDMPNGGIEHIYTQDSTAKDVMNAILQCGNMWERLA